MIYMYEGVKGSDVENVKPPSLSIEGAEYTNPILRTTKKQ